MNYMPEVAKILGVEVGEEFDILVNETEMLVPWPWALEWDGHGFVMRLEVD